MNIYVNPHELISLSLQSISLYADLPPSRQFLPQPCYLCPPWWGGLVLLPLPPRAPLTPLLFMSVLLPPMWPTLPKPHPALILWACPCGFFQLCLFPSFLFHFVCPKYISRSPHPLNFLFLDGSWAALLFPMYLIIFSRICPHKGACESVHCLTHSPLEWYCRQISIPSSAMGKKSFSERAADIISPNLSITCSCGFTPMLCTKFFPPLLTLILYPLPCPSNFRRPFSFDVGRSTHNSIIVIQYPISTFFRIHPNSFSAPDSTSSVEVVLQGCKNTCTQLWILSIRSAPDRGYFVKALSYCRSNRSILYGHITIKRQSGISSPCYFPASLTKFLVECRISFVVVRTWTLLSSSLPCSSFESRSCPINSSTCILITRL